MKQFDDITRIRHMLDASEEASGFLGATSLEELKTNRVLANAIVRSLEVIGEAARQVSQDFKDKHQEIEWQVIVGMRNRLIHAYFDIDFIVVWSTVRNDLPPLIVQLKSILANSPA
jgi:uncharacterized protein with HEPN domain